MGPSSQFSHFLREEEVGHRNAVVKPLLSHDKCNTQTRSSFPNLEIQLFLERS